jgi:signal peptidase I
MFRKRDDEDERPTRPSRRGHAPPRARSWSTRIAWLVLVGGTGLILTRASLATVIQIHGDGMAPTILDGESVIMVRGTWGIEPGDLVVYDPTPPSEACGAGACDDDEAEREGSERRPGLGDSPAGRQIDTQRRANGELHNTAVVDVDEVENNWQRVRERGARVQPRNFRVGRVLAVPGDTVTFHVPNVALGLVVNGVPLQQKPDDPIRLVLAGKPAPGEDPRDLATPRLRALAWETLGDTRYPVLLGDGDDRWPGIGLPDDLGPLELQAEGYLILADNRNEGACCDSRAIGWVPAANIRGELVVRLAGDPGAAPDSDPRSRGLARLP